MAEHATIARPYADAAFTLARDSGKIEAWSGMLTLIAGVVSNRDIAARIGDPNVNAAALENILFDVVGDQLDSHGRSFVHVLVQNRRLAFVSHIHGLYEGLRREHEGMLDARIISALPLTDEQVRQILAALERKYERKLEAQVEVDPTLVGGARIVVGDKVIDASVRGRLDAMAAALAH